MNYRNPQYNQRGTIDCEIEHPKYGWIPFTANPDDPEQHGRDLHAAILASGDQIAAYEPPPPPSTEEQATQARAKRDQLLRESDWVTIRARELDNPVPQAWADYRQALRDVPQQDGFPETISWPAEPEEPNAP